MKIHLCCGDIYLIPSNENEIWENCDITGQIKSKGKIYGINGEELEENPNKTILTEYFKKPFIEDSKKRPEKLIVVDRIMNILEKWPWKDSSIDEIVLINAIEHFDYKEQVPHIINEANRVLKSNGIFKFDFPDILEIVRKYYHSRPHYTMELIYGSRKNQYSRHEWGWTKNSIYSFFDSNKWNLKFRNVVTHDYPSTGVFATKI
jgi:hypothetical protein